MDRWLKRAATRVVPAAVAAGVAFGLAACAAPSSGSGASAQGTAAAAVGGASGTASPLGLPSSGAQGAQGSQGAQGGQGSDGVPGGNLVTATPPGADLPTPTAPAAGATSVSGSLHVIAKLPIGVHLPIVQITPGPSGVIGDPDVPCLQGYVWRRAYAGDYVCVTPATRTQAANDNAAAASRVDPGGAYGSQSCDQGYVWRQVVTNDDVCVTPAVRSAAAYDNSQAGLRIAFLNLWLSDWNPPQAQPTQSCSGNVCTQSGSGGGLPDFQINGDAFNAGFVLLEIRSNAGAIQWSQLLTSVPYPTLPGFTVAAHSTVMDCSSVPGTKANDYAVAFDYGSGRWSNEIPVDSDCANF